MNKGVKQLALLLTLCILCTALSACRLFFVADPAPDNGTEADESSYEHLAEPAYRFSPDYTPVTSRWSYNTLSDRQKKLYDLLLGEAYKISPQTGDMTEIYQMSPVRVPGKLSVAEMRITLRAITDDNPFLFWFSHTFSHYYKPDENYTQVAAYSEFAPAQLGGMIAELGDVLDSFYASVPAGLSEYEREKLVHDYVINACEYDSEIASLTEDTDENIIGHSAYGALVKHRCVCEGYGMALQLLLNGLGLVCVGLSGSSYDSTASQDKDDAQLHLWNAVRLDGEWYQVDATWDDQDDQKQRYDYFNLDDRMTFEDHTLSKTPEELGEDVIEAEGTEDMNLFVPVCTGTKYYYYAYECPHLTDYDGDAVKEALLEAAQNRETTFTFYIDPSYLDYDAAITALFKDSPQYFFSFTAYVNDRLYDGEIDDSNLVYYTMSSRGCVTVELSYY